MGYGTDITLRIWSELSRREDELRSGNDRAGFGQSHSGVDRQDSWLRHFEPAWARDQIGRVDRVRAALQESGPQAQRMIVQRLSGIDLSGIGPVLVSACVDIALLYGASVVAGAFIGGAAGALLGGVGAVPGAAAGAAAGSYAGGWVLALLGLTSLAQDMSEALPRALRYYERGFSEAWGPARHEHVHPGLCTKQCSASFAAIDFANGHVVMVSAMLAALAAYLSRGRSDRAELMKEIAQSPRLGRKVAQWVEQNEARLRQHPALHSRGSGLSGSRVSPHEQRPGSSRNREPAGNPAEAPRPQRPAAVPHMKVPCFTTKGLPQRHIPEFDRQLAGQEVGINNMTVNEYLEGRAAFTAKEAVRNPRVARNARANYEEKLKREMRESLREDGMSAEQALESAEKLTANIMATLAALHNPDMVAGGKDVIADFGNGNVNKRIRAQWSKRQRLSELDKAAGAVPGPLRDQKMNAKLERCK